MDWSSYQEVNNMSNITKLYFEKPSRVEYRLPDKEDPMTGDMVPVRHNVGAPAVITDLGYKAWYQNGIRHREDGPAIEFDDFKVWYVNGVKHRTDGPAVEFSDGSVQYWEHGVRILK